jgi:tetrahydromethanopterin S-methyltransferase subunit H
LRRKRLSHPKKGKNMFKFKTPQQIFEIGRVKVGGQPGELPTVLIPSIFYVGQKIVIDESKGEFNVKEAEELLNKLEQLSDITGNPFMLDVVGTTEEAFKQNIDFIGEATEAPFLIDAISPKLRLSASQYVKEIGLVERAVYSSITKGSPPSELEKIKESKIKAAIILAENPADNSTEGKVAGDRKVLNRHINSGFRAGYGFSSKGNLLYKRKVRLPNWSRNWKCCHNVRMG